MGEFPAIEIIPYEISKNKKMSRLDGNIFARILGFCKRYESCTLTNARFAELEDVSISAVQRSVRRLEENEYIAVKHYKDERFGSRRKIKVNQFYKEVHAHLVEKQSAITGTKSRRTHSVDAIPGIASTLSPEGDNYLDSQALFVPSLYCLNTISQKEPNGSLTEAAPRKTNRGVERVLAHWNSKGKPLARHKTGATQKFKLIGKAVRLALQSHSEEKICAAIDVYFRAVNDPTMTIMQFVHYKKKPRDIFLACVDLDQFFAFDLPTREFIRVRDLKAYKNMTGWFQLCSQGEEAVRERFSIVCKDTSPKMTQLLHEMLPRVIQFDKRNSRVENILRICARKLTKIHADVKHRVVQAGVTKASSVAFVQVHFFRYLEEQNLEAFKIGWLASDRVLESFVYYLETVGVLRKPVMTRHLKRRFIDG